MSRGPGKMQRQVLVLLSQDLDGLLTADLADPYDATAQASCRRALQALQRNGLVTWQQHYTSQGQPRIWKLTEAGKAWCRGIGWPG